MLVRAIGIVVIALALGAALFYSQSVDEPLKVSGIIEADEVRLGSRLGGRVSKVQAIEGHRTSAGDVLVELEPFDLLERRAEAAGQLEARRAELARVTAGFRPEEIAEAKARRDQLAAELERLERGPRAQEIAIGKAQLELAEADTQLAQLQYDRIRSAYERNASTREEMDRATSTLLRTRAQTEVRREELALLEEGTRPEEIAAARAQLEQAEQAWQLRVKGYRQEEVAAARAAVESAASALGAIDRQIEELKIRAPTDGLIEAVDLHPGDLVAPNAPVIAILDTRHMWVRAYVPQTRLGQQVGERVRVTVDSFPGESFAGHLSYIAREAEFIPGNVQTPEERSKQVFRIKVELDEGLDRLRPGMSADVWLDEAPP